MNEKNKITEELQDKMDEMLLYADKFEGILGETPVVRTKPVSEEQASKEADEIRENYRIVKKENGIIGKTNSSWQDKQFSEDLDFHEYAVFLHWAANEITHFESKGTKQGVMAVIAILKRLDLFKEIEKLYTEEEFIDTVYRQFGWAGRLVEDNRQTWSYADTEREHFGYFEANLNTLLGELKDTKGKPYYQGYVDYEEEE